MRSQVRRSTDTHLHGAHHGFFSLQVRDFTFPSGTVSFFIVYLGASARKCSS